MDAEAYRFLWDGLQDPETIATIRRALDHGVVLDTWMNGEEQEKVSDGALDLLATEQTRLTDEAMRTHAIFPRYEMSEQYVNSVFHETLFSTALYVAQKKKGQRRVGLPEAREAVERLNTFIHEEPEDLTTVGGLFFVISTYEDLNAISFYGRMLREDFLMGRLHRPWSNLVLSAQIDAHERMGLVECMFTGEGDMLFLTDLGREVLDRLRDILEEAGEFGWRSENQRWAIFDELDYDKVFSQISPGVNEQTRAYLEGLGLEPGMTVLEIGCGTGRATVDLGLAELVGPSGKVVALDPSAVLLNRLEAKCRDHGIQNVRVEQGMGECLPFQNGTFDATVAVLSLQFTDVTRSVPEMVRVTKSGGLVSALCPPPEFDVRVIPMVAMWFRPLADLANRFGLPFSEHNGLTRGLLEQSFRQSLNQVEVKDVPGALSSEDYKSFLAFHLKGAALFQNVLCRLPYEERWKIIRRLEADGAALDAQCTPEEKRGILYGEAAFGRVS